MKYPFITWVGALLCVICGSNFLHAEDLSSVDANVAEVTDIGLPEIWSLRGSLTNESVPGSIISTSEESNVSEDENNLRNFLKKSLEESSSLRASIHDYNAAVHEQDISTAKLLPTVNLQIDRGRRNSSETYQSQSNSEYQTSSLNLNWPVFRSGAGLAEIKAAGFAAEAARYRVLSAERQQLFEHLAIFLQLLGSSKQVEYLAVSRASMQKVLVGTRKRFKAGFASKTDIAEVSNEIAAIDIQLEQFRLAETEQKARWRNATGKPVSKKLKWPAVENLVPRTSEEAIRKATQNNILINTSELEAESDRYRAKAAMAGFLPRVDVYGQISQDKYESTSNREEYDYEVGARLTVPLVDFSSTSKYRQSRESAIAARYRAIDTERQIARDVEIAWQSYQSSKRQEALIRKRIGLSKRIRTGLIKEYEAGLRPVSDYLIHEVELARLRQDLISNRISTITLAWQIALQFESVTLADLTN